MGQVVLGCFDDIVNDIRDNGILVSDGYELGWTRKSTS